MFGLIGFLIVGLIAGAIARLLVPGKQQLSIGVTTVIGVIGSFVGGFLGYVLINHRNGSDLFEPSGLVGSVIGSVLVLLVWIKAGGRRSLRG